MSRSLLARLVILSGLAGGAIAACLPAPAQTPAGKRYALLVGVTEYESKNFTPLNYPGNDAEEMAKTLKAAGFTSVRVLTSKRGAKDATDMPTTANVRAALKELLAKKTRRDTVLVGLAGHGVQLEVTDPKEKGEPKQYSYFCPSDASLQDISYSTGRSDQLILLDDLFDALGKCDAGHRLALIDACRNNNKVQAARRRIDISRATIPDGVGVLFSCGRGQFAFETPELKHGVFFHHIIQGLKGEAKDRKGLVTWDGLAGYVKREVRDYVKEKIGEGARQTPASMGNLEDETVLARIDSDAPRNSDDKPAKGGPKDRGEKVVKTGRLKVLGEADDDARDPDVVFVPTPQEVVEKMLEAAKVTKGDVVFSLGCGDGRFMVTASKKYGCRSVGFEIDPQRVKDSKANIEKNDLGKLAFVRQRDIFKLDLSEATVVTLYLLPELNVKLIPQLKKLKAGSRIVSHDFDMRGVTPDKGYPITVNSGGRDHSVYLWTTPLKIEKE